MQQAQKIYTIVYHPAVFISAFIPSNDINRKKKKSNIEKKKETFDIRRANTASYIPVSSPLAPMIVLPVEDQVPILAP